MPRTDGPNPDRSACRSLQPMQLRKRLGPSVASIPCAGLLAFAAVAPVASAAPKSPPPPPPAMHLEVPQNNDRIEALSVSPDGKSVAGVAETYVRLFSLESGELLRTFKFGATELVRSAAFSKDGASLFIGSYDRTGSGDAAVHLRRVDVKTGEAKEDYPPVANHDVAAALAVSPDGKTLALADGFDCVLLDLATKKVVWKAAEPLGGAVAFSPDGKLVISGGGFKGASRHFQVLDAEKGTALKKVAIVGEKVHSLSFAPDGKALAVGAAGSKGVEVFDTATWTVSKTLETGPRETPRAAWSPDGKQIAVGNKEGSLFLFDAATGAKVGVATKPTHFGAFTPAVFAVAWSGKLALKAGWGGIDVVDGKATHRASLLSFGNKDGSADWVAVTPDDTYAASANAEKAWIKWWTKDGSLANEKFWPKDKKKPESVKAALKP